MATLAELGVRRPGDKNPANARWWTAGECGECGATDGFFATGRGDVFCDCQRCGECGEEPGWHASGCPLLEEEA